jgi:DNA-binding transcriptional LysR family regulator
MLDGVTLDQLRTFIAAAEQGSFFRGASQALRAQSVVSQTLANLEGQLGVSLFDRRTRGFADRGLLGGTVPPTEASIVQAPREKSRAAPPRRRLTTTCDGRMWRAMPATFRTRGFEGRPRPAEFAG